MYGMARQGSGCYHPMRKTRRGMAGPGNARSDEVWICAAWQAKVRVAIILCVRRGDVRRSLKRPGQNWNGKASQGKGLYRQQ